MNFSWPQENLQKMLTTSTCIIIGDIAMKIDCIAKKLFVDACIYAYIYMLTGG